MGAPRTRLTTFPRVFGPLLVLLVLGLPACGGTAELPSPRPIIVFSGVRVHADQEEMREVDGWLREALGAIEQDDSFEITVVPQDTVGPPWEAMEMEEEIATVDIQRGAPDTQTPYQIYAFLHLMDRRGELDEWLPEAEELAGFEVEKAILDRVGAVWLLGRAVFDTTPFRTLDQILYAREFGYLDAYILTARSEEFAEERERWLAEDPGALEEYREWFRETFETDPPGYVAEDAAAAR